MLSENQSLCNEQLERIPVLKNSMELTPENTQALYFTPYRMGSKDRELSLMEVQKSIKQ